MKRKRFLSVLLALTMVLSMTLTFAGAAGSAFETLVPDKSFRDAIEASMDADDLYTLNEADLKTKLAAFDGEIDARNKGIEDARGIELLRNAELVDLFDNKITDFAFLWNVNQGAGGYYGSVGKDVTWNIGKNPYTRLPSDFGGRLVIEQPASTSSVYDESAFRPRVYLRGEPVPLQLFNITRCKVVLPDGTERWVKANGTPNLLNPKILTATEYGQMSIRLPFSDVKKSGVQGIGIGIDQEIHYMTADEYDTGTPGSQSFKYYIHPRFFVYDRVKIGFSNSVTLLKEDESGTALKGAEYQLRDANDVVLKTYTTDENGLIAITEGLTLGKYTLTETKAPEGYELDSTPIPFEITAVQQEVNLSGGLTTIKTTTDEDTDPTSDTVLPSIIDHKTLTADPNEVFIAGPDVAGASPDINLAPNSGTDDGETYTAHVIYTALELEHDKDGNATKTEKTTRVFKNLAAAAADINTEKNANNIVGSVSIVISATGINAFHFEQTNKKTPPPPYDPGPSTPTVTVKGEKIWVDDNNSGNTRPTSIKVELYRDGGDSPYRTATVSASNNWKYSFTGLTKYRTGNTPYTYTVKEADVPEGYTSAVDSVTNSTGNTVTTTITNTLVPPERPPVTPEEPKEPGDPNDPQNPSEPPATPPTDPGEPPATPPGDPGEPPTTPPTTPPVTPPTNPNLPQTGTVRDSAPALLCLTLATALAGCAVILRSKRKSCE